MGMKESFFTDVGDGGFAEREKDLED